MAPLTMDDIQKQLYRRKKAGIVYDLIRITLLLEGMGNPQDKLPCIHIAGTNGKGSTAAFTAKALNAQGLTVGTFNSPVFGDIHEHVSINNNPLDRDLFLKHAGAYESLVLDTEDQLGQMISEFEWLVGLSYFTWDRVIPVDVVVLEAGMGGRLDATNVVKKPLATAVTNVGLDHQAYLGGTEGKIAREKSGIMRKDVPCFTAAEGKAFDVLQSEADVIGAILGYVAADEKPFELAMAGAHQQLNAQLAFKLTEAAGKALGFTVTKAEFQQAVKDVQVPGRFETIQHHPDVILDTAHNTEAMRTVVKQIMSMEKRPDILFAAMKDKPVLNMLDMLSEVDVAVTVTDFLHERALPVTVYPDRFSQAAEATTWIEQWIEKADVDDCLIITGSHQFIAEVRSYFIKY